MRDKAEIGQRSATPAGRIFIRIKFRIWPGRTAPIENAYKQEMVQTLKVLDPEYADWMVSINTEVSEVPAVIQPNRGRLPIRLNSQPEQDKTSSNH